MKVFFIASSCYVLYLMKIKYRYVFIPIARCTRQNPCKTLTNVLVYLLPPYTAEHRPTHDPSIDTFRVEYLLGPCAVLALLFHYKFTIPELLWSFSIFLESVAILPQLFMLQRTGEAETITTHYLAALGAYRALYIPNWIYRYVIVLRVAWIGCVDAEAPVSRSFRANAGTSRRTWSTPLRSPQASSRRRSTSTSSTFTLRST